MQVKMSLKRLNLNLGTFSQMFETLLSVTYFVPRLGYLVGRFPLVFSRENGEKEVSRLFQVQTALQQKKSYFPHLKSDSLSLYQLSP